MSACDPDVDPTGSDGAAEAMKDEDRERQSFTRTFSCCVWMSALSHEASQNQLGSGPITTVCRRREAIS